MWTGSVSVGVGQGRLAPPRVLMSAAVGPLIAAVLYHQPLRAGQVRVIQGKLTLVSSDPIPSVILVARFMRLWGQVAICHPVL